MNMNESETRRAIKCALDESPRPLVTGDDGSIIDSNGVEVLIGSYERLLIVAAVNKYE